MFCRYCLYDLSKTRDPRCPECGGAFDPDKPETMLKSENWFRWASHQITLYIDNSLEYRKKSGRTFCRTCYFNLTHVSEDKCPICGAWFDRRDPRTYRHSDHMFARLFDRFCHICIWRGILIPIPILIYGIVCVTTAHAILPGYGRGSVQMMRLEDLPAQAMGLAWIGLAMALHSRYFWGRVEATWRLSGYPFCLGVLVVICGWGYAFVWSFKDAFK